MAGPRRIYLDLCCLKRSFDDQTQPRVRLETEAVIQLLAMARSGSLEVAGSPVLAAENSLNPDAVRLERVREVLEELPSVPVDVARVFERGTALCRLGFGPFDAQHIAWAEAAGASVLVSTDDRLLALGKRHPKKLGLRLLTPLECVSEVYS